MAQGGDDSISLLSAAGIKTAGGLRIWLQYYTVLDPATP